MDWSDLGLEKVNNNATGNGNDSRVDFREDPDYPNENPPIADLAKAPRRSLPAGNLGNIREAMTPEPLQQDLWPPQNTPGHAPAGGENPETEPDFGIEAVKTASARYIAWRIQNGGYDTCTSRAAARRFLRARQAAWGARGSPMGPIT